MSENLVTLLLKLPRNTDVTPEAAQTFLSALTKINPNTTSIFDIFKGSNAKPVALEIVLHQGQIQFQLTCDVDLMPFIETQIHSNYPLTIIEKVKDPLLEVETDSLSIAYLKLKQGDYYPLATFTSFKDIDPLSSILSVLSKAPAQEFAVIQIALESANPKWQSNGQQFADFGTKNEDGSYKPRPDAHVIKEKIVVPGFMASIRIASTNEGILQDTISSFGVFNRSDGNSLSANYPTKGKLKKELEHLRDRKTADKQILNVAELATIWHLPSDKIKTPSIVWGSSVLSEPPANLPIATDLSPEEKDKINFFAKTVYKNEDTVFGIKDGDRLRHIWVVGKTGTGKSTMIANMAIDDVKKGRGMAIIDPHGDLCEDILNYIPSNRINDTVYFNPADRDYPISINPLEVTNREEAELVVAGLMSIFTKVWANVWSARMEYILRNSFMTLTEMPDATLADVLKLLSDQSFRNRVVSRLDDQALIHFWKNEFDVMPEKLQKEAISPIQNKVGQFVTSPMIRRIIGTPKSSISIDEIMNGKKILLVNLSQGRLGEDNSALLGAMLITKFQLAAMHRVDIPKNERVPFHLYVDEFQNFATNSFIKILSEARKYGLALLLANQYMAQIPEPITKAILGNAGSMVSFAVGADDARVFHKEFAEVFSENDLVNLENYQIAIKLMVDSHSTRPFVAKTLPLPANANQNRDKVIRVSRERWAKSNSSKDEETPDLSPDQKAVEKMNAPTDTNQQKINQGTENNDVLNNFNQSTVPDENTETDDQGKLSNSSSTSDTSQSNTQQEVKVKKKKKKKSQPEKQQPSQETPSAAGDIYISPTPQPKLSSPTTDNQTAVTHTTNNPREHTTETSQSMAQSSQFPDPDTPVKTIQGEKEMMGEKGFESKEGGPQKVRVDHTTPENQIQQSMPPNNYPNAPKIQGGFEEGSSLVKPKQLPPDHPLMQRDHLQDTQSPLASPRPHTANQSPTRPPASSRQPQPGTRPQPSARPVTPQPSYPPRTTHPQAAQPPVQPVRPQPQYPQMPPNFPRPQNMPGMPPFPGMNPHYPAPRPAFDIEKERREREAKQAEDKAKLADLMKQLDEMKQKNS